MKKYVVQNDCFCKETKNQDKTKFTVLSNQKKIEQLDLFSLGNYEENQPRKKGERHSYRCTSCGRFVSKEVWEMFPKIFVEEVYQHEVKRVKIGGYELPSAA